MMSRTHGKDQHIITPKFYALRDFRAFLVLVLERPITKYHTILEYKKNNATKCDLYFGFALTLRIQDSKF